MSEHDSRKHRHIVVGLLGEVPWNEEEKARIQALNGRDVDIDYAFIMDEVRRHDAAGRTDMFLWYGIGGSLNKKLPTGLEALKKNGYPFKTRCFANLGHGGLAGKHPEAFSQEIQAAHLHAMEHLTHVSTARSERK